jgi:hypothetical protein
MHTNTVKIKVIDNFNISTMTTAILIYIKEGYVDNYKLNCGNLDKMILLKSMLGLKRTV